MITLSICIPSYNRFEKLNRTIQEILEAKSNDFEIVIVDNCSPRDVTQYILCADRRVRIIKRRTPVSGIKSVSDCLLFGKGKYSLLLLDKDMIHGINLDKFIDVLSNNEVFGGYCKINSTRNYFEIVDKKIVERFGFLSKHPSGNFYRMDILRDFIVDNAYKLENDAFNFDIYMAFCASRGSMLYYDSNLVDSVLDKVEQKDEHSLTFSKANSNVYYMPNNRIQEFVTYMDYLCFLNISRKDRLATLKKIYKRASDFVTFEYQDIMRNKVICNHYGHETENILFTEMFSNQIEIRKEFYAFRCKDVNIINKIIFDAEIQIRFVLKILLKKIHNRRNRNDNI